MFHVKQVVDIHSAVRAAEWAGISLADTQLESLLAFHDWLADEAIRNGGLGPNEGTRIWGRHIADSIVFAAYIPRNGEVIDLGSGVGLPGLPLAICLPQSYFVLVDRSQHRCDLARRATRRLGLTNVEVVEADIGDLSDTWRCGVARAVMDPEILLERVGSQVVCERLIVAGPSTSPPESGPLGRYASAVPASVTGRSSWLYDIPVGMAGGD